MKEEDVRRFSGVLGCAGFILVLLVMLVKTTPGGALMGALAAGLVSGFLAYAVGYGVMLSRAPAPPPPAPEPEAPAVSPDETRRFSPDDIGTARLDQTVKLEPGSLDYILPEFSPEQVLKEREGLDIELLEKGIEGTPRPSENTVTKDLGQGGQ